MKASDMKKGQTVTFDGKLYAIVDYQHVKLGKGGAVYQTKFKSLADGLIMDKRIRAMGGGTEFMPVFEYVKEHYPDAACLTYLTDGGIGDYDIDECFEYWSSNLRGVPVIWALADTGWSCCERFTERCNRIGFGVVAELPMEDL